MSEPKKSPYDLALLNIDKETERLERQNQAIAAVAEADFPSISPNARVLDVGSGQGFWAKRLAKKVPKGSVVCLDHSESLLAVARATLEREGIQNAEYILQDVTELSLPVASFDVIHSRITLSHVTPIEHVLERLDAVLKPGGKFVFFEPLVRPSQAPFYYPPCPSTELLFVKFHEAIHRRGSNYSNALAIAHWLKARGYDVQLKGQSHALWDDDAERFHYEVLRDAFKVAKDVLTGEEFDSLQLSMTEELKARPLLMFWTLDSLLVAQKPT